MNQEKLDFYVKKIEKQYSNKIIFNVREVCEILSISRATFQRRIENNDIHKLPKFEKIEYKRKNIKYSTYKFKLYNIAIFLEKEIS